MRTRSHNPFSTVTTAGLLLPVDLLTRVVNSDPDLPGLTPKDYHLRSGERLNEVAARAWNQCVSAWKSFRRKFDALPASDIGTTLTRDEWLLPLFQELGYGRLQIKKAIDFDGKEYPVSHGWENHVPIHLLSARLPLDRRTANVPGAATRAPYSLLQELLNRSAEHRWGFVTNGLKLFLLRDNAALARAANVEFDLEAMMDGEVYGDFFLLFCLCHQSRVEIRRSGKGEDAKESPEDCWLEQWANQADQQGTRAREKLRDGVESAIKSLGAGFLTTKWNDPLRARLRSGELSTQDFYRQLLRLVYRILMLLVAEEKRSEQGHNLLHPLDTPAEVRERYARFYSVGRIRSLAYERRGTAHTDLYESLKVLFLKLRTGYEPLGIPGMGSFLFSEDSTPDLDDALMANQDLLDSFRNLCYTEDTSGGGGGIRRPVDFGNLGSEELGSVYESLLELHPLIDTEEGPFTLGTAAGHERKTTGSYYTPTSLINCLLDSALDPVVNEAIDVPDPAEAERKLLDLKVCDPACGSGHFLIAAAERMATHLARIRTGDDQPGTIDIQHAKRDIIGRCIYGVDINPMAVELCKVSLWMEALEPGKPLSFLDHHIQCGNSLIGATPRLLADGIPDDAFKPIEGDDKKVCADLKKRNKQERLDYKNKQGYLFEPIFKLGNLAGEFAKLTAAEDDTLDSIAAKRAKYADLVKGTSYQFARLWADTWCAAFLWEKVETDLGRLCPTERKFRDIERNPRSLNLDVGSEIDRLSSCQGLFHWHLAFPDVFQLPANDEKPENESCGWNGGFSVIVGNPPWDEVRPEEKKYFSTEIPDIAVIENRSRRQDVIAKLETDDPASWTLWMQHRRHLLAFAHSLHTSNRFKFATTGNLSTWKVFFELSRDLRGTQGCVGVIVPSGIVTNAGTSDLFEDLMNENELRSCFDFENREKFFANVDSRARFSLLTIGAARPDKLESYFGFFLTRTSDLADPTRVFSITAADIATVNPNSFNCPTFRSTMSAELVKQIFRKHQIFIPEAGDGTWKGATSRMFDMSYASKHFSRIEGGDELPLYEGKMVEQFNHRASSIVINENNQARQAQPETTSFTERSDANFTPNAQYWVPRQQLEERLQDKTKRNWLIHFCGITSPTNERTCVVCVTPRIPAGNSLLQVYSGRSHSDCAGLVGNLNSFALDFSLREKMGGINLNHFIFRQLPIVNADLYADSYEWLDVETLGSWIARRVLALVFCSWDIRGFALDLEYDGPPFRWDERRRFLIRCELDAVYFHMYLGSDERWGENSSTLREVFPTPRHAVDYIMDTFPIVRRKDEAKHEGEYKTKTTILKMYDEMAEAIRTGVPYQTWLDPPPGPPADEQGNFIPYAQWTHEIRQRYADVIHPARESEVVTVEPKQPAKPTRKLRPGIAAKSTFPEPGVEFLVCGLTVDLILRKPGLDARQYSEFQGLALRPQNVHKLLRGSLADQQTLADGIASIPGELKDVTGSSVPWDAVLRALEAAEAIEIIPMGDYETLQPGDVAEAAKEHFGCLSDDYMKLVMIAIDQYQSIFQETHEQLLNEDLQQVKNETEAWATATNAQ